VPKHIMLATAVGIGECLVLPVGLPGNSLLMLCDRCWLWL
jgi:hypothetical protein